MSTPALAPAPVPVTAPTAASARRPAPVRVESQPASFADVLDETSPAETATPTRSAKPAKSADAPETKPTAEDAAESDTPISADANAAPPAIVQPPVPAVVLAPAAETPATDDDAPKTDTPPQPLLPAASPVAAVPTGGVAPAPPAPSPVAALAPSAAPVAPLAAAPPPTTAAPSEEAATDTLDPDSASVSAAPDAPPAPRLRDIIEHAASRSGASAQPQSGSTQTAGTSSDTANTAPAPTPQASAAEPSATAPKPAADAPALAAVTAEAAEPTQAVPTAPTADVRTNETTTQSPVLSTLSQGAIHATAQIAAQIVKKLQGRSTRFEMALTPDDLGRIDVSLDIDADGQLSARLAFDNPLAAADLRGRVDELRRQLTEAGFTVAEDALSFDQRDPSSGAGGFDRGPNSQSDRQSARAFGAASRLSLQAEASIVPPRWMSLTLTPERVDMKV